MVATSTTGSTPSASAASAALVKLPISNSATPQLGSWRVWRLGVDPALPGSMAGALWKGSITSVLGNLAVGPHPTVRDSRPRFRLLHANDKSPVKYERVCAREGKPVAWEELVKGYEYEKGRFVVLTKEDFRTAALEKSRDRKSTRLNSSHLVISYAV